MEVWIFWYVLSKHHRKLLIGLLFLLLYISMGEELGWVFESTDLLLEWKAQMVYTHSLLFRT